jgi:hypothetical protein
VLRFGRIPFKITSLVLNYKEKEWIDMMQKKEFEKVMSMTYLDQDEN